MSNRNQPPSETRRSPESSLRYQDGTFAKGVSGNPSGKPKGTRNRVNRLLDDLAATEAVDILAKIIACAKEGDVAAGRMVLRRAWAVPKGRPVDGLELPAVNSPADALAAMGAVTAAVAAGTISTDEARDLTDIFDVYRKMHELADMDRRIARLESLQDEAQ